MKWQRLSARKRTGGRYHIPRKRKKRELGRPAAETRVGPHRAKFIRTHGGNRKIRLLRGSHANVVNPKTKKAEKLEITGVEDNPANKDYARRKVITRGAIIETAKGRARVTSRPGQHGTIQAVLIS